jgi:hypothetical protein
MNVEIAISDPDQDSELTSLEDWLLRDAALRGCTVTRPAAVPRPGEMGAISEVLVVALGSGGSGAALATALSVWLRTRVHDLTIRLQGPAGTIELSAHTTQDPRELVSAITSLVSGSDGTPG